MNDKNRVKNSKIKKIYFNILGQTKTKFLSGSVNVWNFFHYFLLPLVFTLDR